MTSPILIASKIHKTFHDPVDLTVLNGVDLEVYPGDAIAIMGRSGEGKSTLLQVLGTLEPPSQGELTICGQKVSYFSVDRIRSKNIAFVFQSYHLMEDYTVIENILMPAKIARRSTQAGSDAYKKACELLELVGLTDHAHYSAKLLSGGEKQRVAIARALCNDPDIIFADEPSGNLDAETSEMIHQHLLEFAKRKGKAMIIVTHNKSLAALCNKRFFLKDGQLTHLN